MPHDDHEDQVRRLLAQARHDEPVPPDVVARLDRVLADLRADPAAQPSAAPDARPGAGPGTGPGTGPGVVDLEAARRRRRVRTLLVAAAAVVVVGLGVDQLRGLDTGAGGDAGGTSADSAVSAQEDSAAGGAAQDGLEAPSPQDFDAAIGLDPDRFARQVTRIREGRALLSLTGQKAERNDAALAGIPARCSAPGRGRVVVVRYAGSPGLLVFRPVRGETQVVDLYLCGRAGPTRSVTLPAP